MAIGIAPQSIDPQMKMSVVETVKSTVSSMAGKLRDIFNTMIPGRTGSWTPSHSGSSRSSFASSMSRSLSTGSFIILAASDEPARRDASSCLNRPGSPALSTTECTSWLYSEGLRHMEKTMESEASNVTPEVDETSGYESDEEGLAELRRPFSMEEISLVRGWGRSSSDPGPLDSERPYIERRSSLPEATPRSSVELDTSWVFRHSDIHRVSSAFSYLRLDPEFRDDVDAFTRQT